MREDMSEEKTEAAPEAAAPETAEAAARPAPTMGRTIWNLLPLILLSLYLCHYSPSKRPSAELHQCGKFLREIGVAIEKDRLLSEDRLYKKDLATVYGEKPIPSCPIGGKDAYLQGYSAAEDARSYLLVCKGAHHKEAGVPSDYPRIAFAIPESPSSKEEPVQESTPTPSESASPSSATPTPTVVITATPKAVTEAEKDKPKTESLDKAKEEQEVKAVQSSPTPASTPKS